MKNKKLRDRKGQAMIETALVVPVVFLLIFSFLDLGRAIYYYSALQNAVREGARFASVNKLPVHATEGDVISKVVDYSVAVDILASDVSISAVDSLDNVVDDVSPIEYTSSTTKVTVSASYAFKPITPFLAWAFDPSSPDAIVMDVETTMLLAPVAK